MEDLEYRIYELFSKARLEHPPGMQTSQPHFCWQSDLPCTLPAAATKIKRKIETAGYEKYSRLRGLKVNFS